MRDRKSVDKKVKLWIKKLLEYNVGYKELINLDLVELNKLTTKELRILVSMVKSAYSAGCEDTRVLKQGYREVI